MSEKKNEIAVRSSAAEYLTFITASGESGVEAVYADENVWLSQKMMALLYDVETNTVNYHLKKAYSDQELDEESTIRNFRILRKEGTRNVERDVLHYNLKAVLLSVSVLRERLWVVTELMTSDFFTRMMFVSLSSLSKEETIK